MHNLFDALLLWFEAVPVISMLSFILMSPWLNCGQNTPHTYNVCSTDDVYLRTVPNRLVTFTANDGLDLPDPRYLKLHATICRVAHMSGVA
jgi:hypothetical protein